MKFLASGFTHRGTIREKNEDALLMHDRIIRSGDHDLELLGNTRFFVADGVGGAPAGEVASRFVLRMLNERVEADQFPDAAELKHISGGINKSLFDFCALNPQYSGMATTLSGVFLGGKGYRIFNAGDSRVLLFRKGALVQLTEDDKNKYHDFYQPILNYFGGYRDVLIPRVSEETEPIYPGDVFIATTDGLFHCFSTGQLEKILANSKSIREKAALILRKSLEMGSPDNISCIFIHCSA